MKFKKQIVLICLISFLFVSFQIPKKAEGEVLIATGVTILMAGALLASVGIVIANSDELAAFGNYVGDTVRKNMVLKDGNYYIEKSFGLMTEILNATVEMKNKGLIDFLYPPSHIPFVSEKSIKIPFSITDNLFSFSVTNTSSSYARFNFRAYAYSGDGLIVENDMSGYIVQTIVVPGNTTANYKLQVNDGYQKKSYNIDLASDKFTSSYWMSSYSLKNSALISDLFISVEKNDYTSDYLNYSDFLLPGKKVSSSLGNSVSPDYSDKVTFENALKNPDVIGGSISIPQTPSIPGFDDKVGSSDWTGSLDFPYTGEGVISKPVVGDIPGVGVGAIPKPNVGIGDIPVTGEGLWDSLMGLLGSLFAPLLSLLSWIGDILNSILDFLGSLVVPKEMIPINFKPLYFSFSNKFPFCIPFDIVRMVSEFVSVKKAPVFEVDMSAFSTTKSAENVGFTIDLTKFDELILIIRTLILVSFIISLAFKTRDIIKG